MPYRFSTLSVFLNDYVLLHTYTSDCNLHGKSVSFDYHHTSAATLTTSWQSGAFPRNYSYLLFLLPVTRSPSLCFSHHITRSVRRSSGSSFAQTFKSQFLEFPVYFCKTTRAEKFQLFPSISYTCRLHAKSLIGSQATQKII